MSFGASTASFLTCTLSLEVAADEKANGAGGAATAAAVLALSMSTSVPENETVLLPYAGGGGPPKAKDDVDATGGA